MSRVPGKFPPRKFPPRKLPPMKISPYEYVPLWKLPPVKITPLPTEKIASCENFPLGKLPPMKSPPHLQIIQMKKKTKLQIFLPWRKLCNTISLHTGLRYFLYRMKKIQKSNQSENRRVTFTCQLYKSRRTKTWQSNYKTWQICETTK